MISSGWTQYGTDERVGLLGQRSSVEWAVCLPRQVPHPRMTSPQRQAALPRDVCWWHWRRHCRRVESVGDGRSVGSIVDTTHRGDELVLPPPHAAINASRHSLRTRLPDDLRVAPDGVPQEHDVVSHNAGFPDEVLHLASPRGETLDSVGSSRASSLPQLPPAQRPTGSAVQASSHAQPWSRCGTTTLGAVIVALQRFQQSSPLLMLGAGSAGAG